MAYNRSFRFYGIGFGTDPVEITAEVNGVQVYSGAVPTVNEPIWPPALDPFAIEQIAFTIDDSSEYNTDFGGSVPMSITVTRGDLFMFTTITCNYSPITNPVFSPEQLAVINDPNSTSTVSEVSSIFISLASPPFSPEEEVLLVTLLEIWPDRLSELDALLTAHNVNTTIMSADAWETCFNGFPTNSDNTTDPKSNVKINDILQPVQISLLPCPWGIYTGNVLTCNLNISPFI